MQRLGLILYYLRESPMLAAGLCMILLVLLFGVLGPVFVDTSRAQPLATTPRLEPSWEHPFGTDDSALVVAAADGHQWKSSNGIPLFTKLRKLSGLFWQIFQKY